MPFLLTGNIPDTNNVKPPKWLGKAELVEWKRLAAELSKVNLLTNLDVVALARCCVALVKYQGAKEEVEKSGIMIATERGAQKKNPAFEVRSQTAAEMQKIEGEFGMTPSSRGRLKPAEGEGDDSFKGKRLSLNGTRASAQIQRTLPFISESCLFGSVRLMHC